MTLPPSTNRCKGTCFTDFRAVVVAQHGADAWERIAGALDRDLGDPLQYGAIVTGGWYPLSWYRHLHEVTHRTLNVGLEFSREVGRASTVHGLTRGLYKVFLKIVSPQFVVTNAAKLFNAYYERGAMVVDEKRAGLLRASWSGCAAFDQVIWEDVFGGCLGALEAAGARDVRLRLLGGGLDGCETAELEAAW